MNNSSNEPQADSNSQSSQNTQNRQNSLNNQNRQDQAGAQPRERGSEQGQQASSPGETDSPLHLGGAVRRGALLAGGRVVVKRALPLLLGLPGNAISRAWTMATTHRQGPPLQLRFSGSLS